MCYTALAVAVALSAVACGASTGTSRSTVAPHATGHTVRATPTRTPSSPASTTATPTTASPTTATPTPASPSRTQSPPARQTRHDSTALPRGGHRILGRCRVVAYYGGPDGPALGVLGSADADTIAHTIRARSRDWRGYGLPVQPAMELIASVAQGAPGLAGLYSAPIPDDAVQRYVEAAHRHRMLLILDIQPGRGEFLPQVQHFARFLADPWVSIALDPEWKVSAGEVPGTVIGSSSAAGVLAVRDYLAALVAAKHLPDKLMIVHQFTRPMLPDRDRIVARRGVEVVFHADGFGGQAEKIGTWRRLAFPRRPYGTGFKLFLRDDTDLMSPDQVMALRPRPDVLTYQ